MQSLIFISTFLLVLAILTSLTKPLYEKILEIDLKQKINAVTAKHFHSSAQDKSETAKPNYALNGLEVTVDIDHLSPEKANAYLEELDQIFGVYLTGNKSITYSSNATQPKKDTETVNTIDKFTPSTSSENEQSLITFPYFNITENNRDPSLLISGKVASLNEKQELLSALTKESNKAIIDELIVSKEVTTMRQRERLFQLCAHFLEETQNASLEWSPQQIKIAGEMKSEKAIAEIQEQFSAISSEDDEIIATNLHLIKPPSLDFTLERLSNNTIILKGTLPNKAMGDALYQLVVKSHTSSIGINDKTYIANNMRYADLETEAWWFGVPETFIGDFLKQTEGIAKIEYSKSGLYIEGVYKKQDEFIRARSSFQAIPKHLDVYDDFLRVKGETKKNNTPLMNKPKLKDNSSSPTAP